MTRSGPARTRWAAVAGGAALIVGLLFPAGPAQAKPAQAKAVRPPQVRTADHVGQYNAAIVYAGQPHEFYSDISAGSLRHAWWDGTKWNFETLDGPGSSGGNGRTTADQVGRFNAVVQYGSQLHVWYRDTTAASLRHAWWDGVSWHFETLDGTGSPGGNGRTTTHGVGLYSAVVLYGGQPHVWYYDESAGSMRHAWWDGVSWHFEILDGPGSPGGNGRTTENDGLDNSVALYLGQPHVWTRDTSSGTLRHGWWDGVSWHFEFLDGTGAPGGNGRTLDNVGQYSAVTLYGGLPHIWYFDGSIGALRHGWWDGAKWNFQLLDGPGSVGGNGRTGENVGVYNAVVLYGGQPHVWYADDSVGTWRHGWWDGTTWHFENLDGPGTAGGNGRTTDIVGSHNAAVLFAGLPHVWTWDSTSGSLRHAWWDGARWTFETLDGP